MSYSKLIHEYLDGGIDSTQEAMLFDMLSKDSELRADFNKQMKLHLIAQQDMNHITPPAEATDELFGRLGFTVPDYLETPAPSIAEKVSGYIKKYGVMALLLLLTSALSVVITSNYQGGLDKGQSIATSKVDDSTIPVVSSFENENIKSASDISDLNTTQNARSGADNQYNNATQFDNANNTNNNQIYDNDNQHINADNLTGSDEKQDGSSIFDKIASLFISEPDYSGSDMSAEISESTLLGSNSKGRLTAIPSNSLASSFVMPSFGGNEDTKFEFGFKYTSDYSGDSYAHLAIDNQFYDNMIVSGVYHADKYHAFGVEFGWQRFAQSFVTNYYGELTEQKQYPRRFLAGLTYRFTYTNLLGTEFIAPYSEIFAGGSSLGPISKINAGISLTPLNNFSMNIGYEYGILYYSVDSKTYNSENQGFVYRISYNF